MYIIIIIFCIIIIYHAIVRLSQGKTKSSVCLVGKTAIVTGANRGLGYQTALNLASRGCKVIMADIENMEESKRNIIKFTNNTNIITRNVDLSSLESVRHFATEIRKSEPRLDILINNAGIGASLNQRTDDGLHPLMQINYFGPFLLTHLLIDLLRKSAPSRIVFTSSGLAFTNNLTPENLNFDADSQNIFTRWLIYGNSKLALLIASDIFAEKLENSGVTSNSLHPGVVKTGIFSQGFSVHKNLIQQLVVDFLVIIFGKNVWEGAQCITHVAVAKNLEKVSGKHFWDCVSFVKPFAAYDRKFCREIWDVSEKYVKLAPEEKL